MLSVPLDTYFILSRQIIEQIKAAPKVQFDLDCGPSVTCPCPLLGPPPLFWLPLGHTWRSLAPQALHRHSAWNVPLPLGLRSLQNYNPCVFSIAPVSF